MLKQGILAAALSRKWTSILEVDAPRRSGGCADLRLSSSLPQDTVIRALTKSGQVECQRSSMAGFVHYLRLTNSVLLFLSTPFAEAGETGVPCFRGASRRFAMSKEIGN